MKMKSIAGVALLLAAVTSAHAQLSQDAVAELTSATVTSNVPPRSGEASTMTNGVPNVSTSNPQPGEMGIQSRLVVRKSVNARLGSDTSSMGAAGTGPSPAGASPTAAIGTVR